jgi:hypothetical protein
MADLRFGRRHLVRAPLTTSIMFVVLAAGIAISVLLYAMVHSIAAAPPAGVERADDLVRIRGVRGRDSPGDSAPWVRTISVRSARSTASSPPSPAQRANVSRSSCRVTPSAVPQRRIRDVRDGTLLFRLGVQPVLGRGLPADRCGRRGGGHGGGDCPPHRGRHFSPATRA